jgi:predicted HAD superfamily Cof-like phosphohydrolase
MSWLKVWKDVNKPVRNSYEQVKEFMLKFGHPVYKVPTEIKNEPWLEMRLGLILEELCELYEACGYETAELKAADVPRQMAKTDIVAVADALGDIEYVVNGMALGMGINLPAVVSEIHRSNMTKLGADGKPVYREDGKILKGESYEPPNLLPVLGM